MTARFIIGDVFDVLATIPDNSVDLVLTSPPFLALRSYLPADHPDKGKEIGSEPTPAAFLDTLLDLATEWRRVLAPHGSIAVELGDTYSGSGGAGGDYTNDDGMRVGQPTFRQQRNDGWPLPKSLAMIPSLFAASLAYGRNLLNPEHTIDPWRVRNVVAWCRPNPPVGALGDKFRPATSYMTIACPSGKRYFDLDAVREPGSENTHARTAKGVKSRANTGKSADDENRGGNFSTLDVIHDTNGAPPLDYWVIPTAPYSGSHYATYPPDLCVKPIKAMCPMRVCRVCGEPSRRIVSEPEYVSTNGGRVVNHFDGDRRGAGVNAWEIEGGNPGHVARIVETLGWSDCGHDDYRTGVVLDPFAGSGTTLAVATGHGRDAIGIDLDERNADLALDRVGPMLLTVEHFGRELAS